MAYNFKYKILRINRQVEIENLPGEQIVVASNSTPLNCAILISYSGESSEVLKINSLHFFKLIELHMIPLPIY